MDCVGERILFTNQTLNIYRLPLEQLKRRLKPSTTRSNDRNLVNNNARGVDLSRSLKRRLQNQPAFRPQ
jgi:hypothetical protein